MRNTLVCALLPFVVVVCCSGCKKESAKKSQAGESCAKASDCSGSLRCVNQRCVAEEIVNRAKAIEATEGLEKLAAGAKSFFHADHYDNQGNILPKRFPKGDTGWVPSVPCCKQPEKRCQPDNSIWGDPWRELHFQLTEPHQFQWRYSSKGEGAKATFVIEARGDPDCTGKPVTYKITGSVDSEFGVNVKGPTVVP